MRRTKQTNAERLEQKKAYYSANREAILGRMAEYRAKNKDSINARNKKRWQDNRDRYLKVQRAYYRDNHGEIRQKRKLYWEANRDRFLEERGNDPRYRFMHARTTARRRGLDFSITEDKYLELIGPDSCAYCGFPLARLGYGLDRIDNDIGYLPSNVIPCCKECNRARSNLFSFDEMKSSVGPAIRRVKEDRLTALLSFALFFPSGAMA